MNHRQIFKASGNFWRELSESEGFIEEDLESIAYVRKYNSQPWQATMAFLLSPEWLARVISDHMDKWEGWGREGAPFIRVGRRLRKEALTGERVVVKRSSSPRRKNQTHAPTWAKTLVQKVCREEGVGRPRMTWNGGEKSYVTGSSWGWRFHVTAGRTSTRLEQKLVVLHELAHCFAGADAHHNQEFWEICWRLYRRHGIPVRYALKREYHGAKVAYRKIQRANRKPVEMEVMA